MYTGDSRPAVAVLVEEFHLYYQLLSSIIWGISAGALWLFLLPSRKQLGVISLLLMVDPFLFLVHKGDAFRCEAAWSARVYRPIGVKSAIFFLDISKNFLNRPTLLSITPCLACDFGPTPQVLMVIPHSSYSLLDASYIENFVLVKPLISVWLESINASCG